MGIDVVGGASLLNPNAAGLTTIDPAPAAITCVTSPLFADGGVAMERPASAVRLATSV